MKYTCAKCKGEFEYAGKVYGGYVIDSGKDLCPKCWKEYLEIRHKLHQEMCRFWETE